MTDKKIEDQMLAKLKNRPGIDPNPLFVSRLRNQIMNEVNPDSRGYKWRKISVVASVFVSLMIILVLSLSSLEMNRHQATDILENHDPFQLIIEKNKAFLDIYNEVVKVTGMQEQSKNVIYYLEGLRRNDDQLIRSVLEEPVDEVNLRKLKQLYHNVDFSMIKLKAIFPNVDQDQMELVFLIKRGSVSQVKHIYLKMSDEKNIRILDPIFMDGWDTTKDQKILDKVKEIESLVHLGMSKEEAIQTFGANFRVVTSLEKEDESVEKWSLSFLVEEGAVIKENESVDLANILNQNIGVQLIIGWLPNETTNQITLHYGQSGVPVKKQIGYTDDAKKSAVNQDEVSEDFLKFSPKEKEAYNWFRLEQNIENLMGLSPITVAKFYIQAELDEDFVTQYALYTTREDRIMWSKEQHMEYSEEPQDKQTIMRAYEYLADGHFVKSDEQSGYIYFQGENGPMGFQMVKDKNGVWKVSFMPIQ